MSPERALPPTDGAASQYDGLDPYAQPVSIHAGLSGLQSLRDDWQRLVRDDERYWMQYGFVEESLRHSPAGCDDIRIVAIRDRGGQVESIVPLRFRRHRIRGVSFKAAELIGTTFDDITCQASGVDIAAASPEAAVRALQGVIDALRGVPERPSLLLLGRTRADSVISRAVEQSRRLLRPPVVIGAAKSIRVDRSFADIQAALASKFRISLRSALRNLRGSAVIEFGTTAAGDPGFVESFAAFLEIEASGWKGAIGSKSGMLVNPAQHQRNFFQAISERQDTGRVELHWLKVDREIIASQLWLRRGGVRVAFKIGYREAFARFQPGHLLVEHVLRDSCEDQTLHTVDFVSDAQWLDKWRVDVMPHRLSFLHIGPVTGRLAQCMLMLPTMQMIRERVARWVPAPTRPVVDADR